MQKEHWAGFWEHVDDLRDTLLRSLIVIGIGFLCLLTFYQPLLHFLATYPIEHTETQSPLLIMGPIEGLVLVFKTCFWLSVALTAPIWGWIWLQFILPGLKNQEKAFLIPFLLCSFICVGMGIACAYYVILPIANQYLFLFNSSIGQNAWTLSHYINYVLLLCLGHAIAAEIALLLLMLVHFRFLSIDWLIAKRRYMIVIAFIIGALLTPPDVLTQLLLAIPLIGLYEIAIWYAKWLGSVSKR